MKKQFLNKIMLKKNNKLLICVHFYEFEVSVVILLSDWSKTIFLNDVDSVP